MMTGFLKTLDMITEPQARFLKSLLKDHEVPEGYEHEANVLAGEMWGNLMTKRQASAMIDAVKSSPKKSAQTPAVELKDGMYRKDGVILKVYHTVHGANQQVAKKLVVTREGTPLAKPFTNDAGDYVYWEVEPEAEFVYLGKVGLRGLLPEHKLTLEGARKFGHVYGVCGRCSRTLTREESIERGIGPVCWGKMEEGL